MLRIHTVSTVRRDRRLYEYYLMERFVGNRIIVDLDAVRHNVRFLRSLLPARTRFMAAVKADAYGHGAVAVSRAVLEAGGWGLAVATAEEAVELRDAGIAARVLVMGPVCTVAQLEELARRGIEVAVVSPGMVSLLRRVPVSGPVLKVHAKLDTGMNRQGLLPGSEVEALLDVARSEAHVQVVGIMTHFANSSDEPDSVPWQLERFLPCVERIRGEWPEALVHAASSAAVIRHPEAHFDAVRCGIAVYGLSPFQGDARAEGLMPVMSWTSRVAMVKRVAAGEGVGYGLTFRPVEAHEVALVSAGYADGVFRALGNRGQVIIRGRRRLMVGRVSMDSFSVDLGDNADAVRAGDTVTLIGGEGTATVSAEDVARWAGTINYEIPCAVKLRRADRVFLHETPRSDATKTAPTNGG